MKPSVAMSRREFAARLLAAALGTASLSMSSSVGAQGKGRLNPDERERLRQELRERGAGSMRDPGSGRGDPGSGYPSSARGDPGASGYPAPGRRSDAPGRERLSDDERAQLRRQLREAERRRD